MWRSNVNQNLTKNSPSNILQSYSEFPSWCENKYYRSRWELLKETLMHKWLDSFTTKNVFNFLVKHLYENILINNTSIFSKYWVILQYFQPILSKMLVPDGFTVLTMFNPFQTVSNTTYQYVYSVNILGQEHLRLRYVKI